MAKVTESMKSIYLKKVRNGCAERKPWLPRPAFDPALVDAMEGDYESELLL
jgi:hypothetical protein